MERSIRPKHAKAAKKIPELVAGGRTAKEERFG